MKKLALIATTLSAAFILSAATVSAEELPVKVSDNQLIQIELPGTEWEQVETYDYSKIIFSDGKNDICIDLYDPDDEIFYRLPDDECEIVYATSYMTKDFVVFSEGLCYEEDEEVFEQICEAMGTIKIDKEIAKEILAEINSEAAVSENAAGEANNAGTVEKTGELQVIVDESGNYRTIYEYTDDIWRDDNGNTFTTAFNRDGYFYGSDGKEYCIGSDRSDREPDVIVYSETGMAHDLYDNGDGTAVDAFGNPYQYAGDGDWIDYYGNRYYEGAFSADYESNDYAGDITEAEGEYITSVDGITRYVYWQNEFYAVDDEGNEYIFSGYDGTLRSSDGLEF